MKEFDTSISPKIIENYIKKYIISHHRGFSGVQTMIMETKIKTKSISWKDQKN